MEEDKKDNKHVKKWKGNHHSRKYLNSILDSFSGRMDNASRQNRNESKPNIGMVVIDTVLCANHFTFSYSPDVRQIDIDIKMNDLLKKQMLSLRGYFTFLMWMELYICHH